MPLHHSLQALALTLACLQDDQVLADESPACPLIFSSSSSNEKPFKICPRFSRLQFMVSNLQRSTIEDVFNKSEGNFSHSPLQFLPATSESILLGRGVALRGLVSSMLGRVRPHTEDQSGIHGLLQCPLVLRRRFGSHPLIVLSEDQQINCKYSALLFLS